MSKLDLDAQYELAARIQNLIMFVGLLTPDEVDALKELKENLQKSNSTMGAVAGILAPLTFDESLKNTVEWTIAHPEWLK